MEENFNDWWNGIDFPSDKKFTVIPSELNCEMKYAKKMVLYIFSWLAVLLSQPARTENIS